MSDFWVEALLTFFIILAGAGCLIFGALYVILHFVLRVL